MEIVELYFPDYDLRMFCKRETCGFQNPTGHCLPVNDLAGG